MRGSKKDEPAVSFVTITWRWPINHDRFDITCLPACLIFCVFKFTHAFFEYGIDCITWYSCSVYFWFDDLCWRCSSQRSYMPLICPTAQQESIPANFLWFIGVTFLSRECQDFSYGTDNIRRCPTVSEDVPKTLRFMASKSMLWSFKVIRSSSRRVWPCLQWLSLLKSEISQKYDHYFLALVRVYLNTLKFFFKMSRLRL